MELSNLILNLKECQKSLDEAGAIGVYLDDITKKHGARIAVHMRSEDMPKGQAVYDTKTYTDYTIKNVVINDVAFFCLLTLSESYEEGITDFWGVLN